MKSDEPKSLRSSIGWMLVGQCAGYLLRVVYFVLIARALGVVQYGAVAAAFAFVSLGAQYTRLGSGMVLLRYVSGDRGQFRLYWGNVLVTTLIASIGITLIFWTLAPHILDARSVPLVAFTAAASCVFEQVTISTTQVFQAFQRMGYMAGLNVSTSLFRTLAAGGLLLLAHHATAREWVILSMLVSAVAAVVGLVAVCVSFGMPKFSHKLFQRRFGEGLEYSFAASTNSAYDDLDKTMLSHFGMTGAVGIYAMAYRVIEMATVPITSIQLAAEPRQFAFGPDGIEDSAVLAKRLLSKSILMSLVTALILFVGAPVLPVLVGRNFAEAVSALRWLCLIPLFRSVHHLTGSVLTCAGRQRARTANQVAAAVLNFLINLWLIPRFGWQGAAGASLLTDGALGLMNWITLRSILSKRKLLSTGEIGSPQGQLVSIIIPYYKQERFLLETVESCLALTYPNVEIIVVDDGSPVSAESLLASTPSVRIVRTENRGVSAARNLGASLSKGAYLMFLDADDVLQPRAIEVHFSAFEREQDALMTFGAVRIVDEAGNSIRDFHVCRPRRNFLRCLLTSNPVGCPGAAMMKRTVFESIGGFNEQYSRAEDYLCFLKIAVKGKIARFDDGVVSYRSHSTSVSRNRPAMLLSTMAALDAVSEELSASDRRYLPHARRRWQHAYGDEGGLWYQAREFYFKIHAMTTVPISAYFDLKQRL